MSLYDRSWNYRNVITTWTEKALGPDTPYVVSFDGALQVLPAERVLGSDPNWRIKVAKGLDATTPYLHSGYRIIEPGSCSGVAYNLQPNGDKNYQRFTAVDMSSWVGSLQDDVATRDIALKRVKSKLADDVNQFQALVPLVEVRELRGLVNQMANFTMETVRSLVEIKKHPRRAAQHAADTWLAFSFGMRPMMSDAKTIAESIAAYQLRKDLTVRHVGSATRSWTTNINSPPVNGGTGSYLKCKTLGGRLESTLSHRYITAFHLLMESANNYSVSDHFQTSLSALPSVAWELTAFSWIGDYFGTVGAFLDDAFTSPPGNVIYLVHDTKYNAKFSTNLIPYLNTSIGPTVHVEDIKEGVARAEYFYFKRDKLASLPHRALRFKTVDEIGISGVNKLLNLAALLVK